MPHASLTRRAFRRGMLRDYRLPLGENHGWRQTWFLMSPPSPGTAQCFTPVRRSYGR